MSSAGNYVQPRRGWPWWFWAMLAAPLVALAGWWAWNESAVFPLSDGEYWCEESATLPGPGNLKFYNPAGAFAVQLEDGIPVTARPFDVKYAPNSPTGSEVIYGKKVAAPTEIVQKGHSTFMASIDGHTVECRYESPGR